MIEDLSSSSNSICRAKGAPSANDCRYESVLDPEEQKEEIVDEMGYLVPSVLTDPFKKTTKGNAAVLEEDDLGYMVPNTDGRDKEKVPDSSAFTPENQMRFPVKSVSSTPIFLLMMSHPR